ncbi:MAG: hypothetical protein A2776_00815 [Candidatus Levybacteria bacterium RIFCSPHIGHO2_01_FULL_40_10]|nr:MAG: hypothetical protein A2776_00815 [Candidatus Levybacteria bacterium RIFCSPHIGHO2_01_FULL_40_10]
MSSKTKNTKVKNPNKKIPNKKSSRVDIAREIGSEMLQNIMLPQRVIRQIADEVGKVVTKRISIRRKKSRKTNTKIDNSVFLDTSAIIDMRVFDLAKIGALYGTFIVLESVLSELKNIADSKDSLKKERGRRAMDALDRFKRAKGIKVKILNDEVEKVVDESIIDHAKKYKGRIITCDYNLSKKARISNVVSVDLYEMTNILKTTALPGEEFFVKIVQPGKGVGQGVGYLPDGTMLVVEQGKNYLGKTIEVEVSRIIQTDAGKILFSKIKSAE